MHSITVKVFFATLAGLATAAGAKEPTPNILFIFTDD